MIVFLTSSPSGPLDNSRSVLGLDEMNHFVDNLKKYWPDSARALMITAFPDDDSQNDQMVGFFAGAIRDAGLPLETLDLWDHRALDTSLECLLSYHVVMLGGGHVPTQNDFFIRIGLAEKMRAFPGIVIGISAGTMNSAEIVYAQPELDGESLDPNYRRWIPGLGLTKTNILPHYQMVRDNMLDGRRLFADITCTDSIGHRFLALTDGSYLLSCDGRETVWGEAYEIRDGIIRQICETDNTCVW